MIRRNPDIVAMVLLLAVLAWIPGVAHVTADALPAAKVELLRNRVRRVDEELQRRIERKLPDKVREKMGDLRF